MKVTVKPKQTKEFKIPFDEIPVGSVYVVRYCNGPVALKLEDNEAVLLSYSGSDAAWLELATDYKGIPAYKILGKLTEIIVEEVWV